VRLRRILPIIMIIAIVLTFSGCGASKNAEMTQSEMPKSEAKQQAPTEPVGFNNNQADMADSAQKEMEGNTTIDSGRKIISSAYLIMETNNFDEVTTAIINQTNSVGGYIESSDISGRRLNNQGTVQNRRAFFKLRIPEARLTGFLLDFNNLGNVINSQTRGEDITSQYFDTEARLKSLHIHEERLLEILKKAAKIEDVITLEKELSNIRYQIENFTGTLKKWDNLVSFATLDVEVMEVQEILAAQQAPVLLQDKMASGFSNSVKLLTELSKGFLIIIVSLIPFAVIFVPLGLVALYVYRKRNNEQMKQ